MKMEKLSKAEIENGLAKIFAVFSEILFNPNPDTVAVYRECADAFNLFSQELAFNGAPFEPITFNDNFFKDFARLFYGVGNETLGLTHAYWSEGGVSVAGYNTGVAFDLYLQEGLKNATNLPEDHLAVETAFLAKLLSENRTASAISFVEKEILAWWPTFISRLSRETQNMDIVHFFDAINSALLLTLCLKE